MGAKGLPDNANRGGGPRLVARLSRKDRSVRRACSAVAGSWTRSSRTEHSQLKISSPRCQCMRRLVESVLPTTRKANSARQTSGATAANMTQFIADPAISMASSLRVMTHPWCGMSRAISFSRRWSLPPLVSPSL